MMSISITRTVALTGALAAAIALTGCGSTAGSEPAASASAVESIPLTLAIAAPGPNPVGAWAEGAQAAGIYDAVGAEMTFSYLTGTATASTLVQSGQALAAFAGSEGIPASWFDGTELVSIFQASYSTNFPFGFLEGSPVQDLSDLEGARVGVLSPASASVTILDAALREQGLTLDDVELVPIGVGPSAVTAIQQGAVDFLAYYQAGYTQLELAGIEVRVENFEGTDVYPGQVIFTTKQNIEDHPAELQRLVDAVAAAYRYCSEDAEECVQGWADTVGVDDVDSSLKVWESMLTISQLPEEAAGTWGWSADVYWQNLVDIQVAAGLIPEAPAISDLYTNEFVDAVSD